MPMIVRVSSQSLGICFFSFFHVNPLIVPGLVEAYGRFAIGPFLDRFLQASCLPDTSKL